LFIFIYLFIIFYIVIELIKKPKIIFYLLWTVSTSGRLGAGASWTNKCYKTDQTAEEPAVWNGHTKESSTRFRCAPVWPTDWSGSQGCSGCY